MILQPKLEVGPQCSVFAKLEIPVPERMLLSRVLRDNGYDGSIGIEFLHEHYGQVLSNGDDVLAFFGVHYGKQNKLMSQLCLKWHHFVLRRAMNAGFFGCIESSNYTLLQIMKKKLGHQIAIDVIGCTSVKAYCSNLNRAARAPIGMSWIGVCQRGWLAIDQEFFLLDLYDSLSDLLHERSGIEILGVDH